MRKMYNRALIPTARKLRKQMTKEERYEYLKDHAVKFVRQKVLGYYIVDFYAPSLKMVIEIDGSYHHTEQGMLYDEKRANFFRENNIVVFRITNESVNDRFEETCNQLENHIQKRLSQME